MKNIVFVIVVYILLFAPPGFCHYYAQFKFKFSVYILYSYNNIYENCNRIFRFPIGGFRFRTYREMYWLLWCVLIYVPVNNLFTTNLNQIINCIDVSCAQVCSGPWAENEIYSFWAVMAVNYKSYKYCFCSLRSSMQICIYKNWFLDFTPNVFNKGVKRDV